MYALNRLDERLIPKRFDDRYELRCRLFAFAAGDEVANDLRILRRRDVRIRQHDLLRIVGQDADAQLRALVLLMLELRDPAAVFVRANIEEVLETRAAVTTEAALVSRRG